MYCKRPCTVQEIHQARQHSQVNKYKQLNMFLVKTVFQVHATVSAPGTESASVNVQIVWASKRQLPNSIQSLKITFKISFIFLLKLYLPLCSICVPRSGHIDPRPKAYRPCPDQADKPVCIYTVSQVAHIRALPGRSMPCLAASKGLTTLNCSRRP